MLYEEKIKPELNAWQKRMSRAPSFFDKLSKKMQVKMNSYIPEKVHLAITGAIKAMVRGVLFGAKYITSAPPPSDSLLDAETKVIQRIKFYRNAAAAEGGFTGAGGILLGLADFPILLSMKLKLLFDIASIYGYSVKDYKERLFILHIFQLAFSSQQHRRKVYDQIISWDQRKEFLPNDINQFDWREF